MKKEVKLTVSFKDDFIPFLKNNQACKDYTFSVLRYHSLNKDKAALQDFHTKLQVAGPWGWISGMFVWEKTNKGQEFWSTINDLWKKFLQDEAGTGGGDFKLVGEISKSDVEEVFFLEYLRGQYYRVTDLSYNRPVTDEWDRKEWELCESSAELHKLGGTYLILSDYPEYKVMLWHGGGSLWTKPMIKVWVPELDRAQWVFYKESGLRETE